MNDEPKLYGTKGKDGKKQANTNILVNQERIFMSFDYNAPKCNGAEEDFHEKTKKKLQTRL